MTTIYVLIWLDWLQGIETFLFKKTADRDVFIEQDIYQSYRLCEYQIEDDYAPLDYLQCENMTTNTLEETISQTLD